MVCYRHRTADTLSTQGIFMIIPFFPCTVPPHLLSTPMPLAAGLPISLAPTVARHSIRGMLLCFLQTIIQILRYSFVGIVN